jgi:hypothetical protein
MLLLKLAGAVAAEPQAVRRFWMEPEVALAGTPVYAVIPSAVVKLLSSLGSLVLQGISRLTALLGRSR